MRVPMTAFREATRADTSTVTRSDASAAGAVTASQKPAQPSSKAATVSAASGSSTMTLSQSVATPTPSGWISPDLRSRAERCR
jgi:hypothetical protein